MTDMLQKTENVANNVVNENSQDLTSQWKKGELPSGWYWVRLIRGEYRIDLYINGKNEWIDCPDNIIDTVVCEVPSYEAWMEKTKSLKVLAEAYCKEKQQNKQLKDLLKECKYLFNRATVDGAEPNNAELIMILTKIDEVLK